MTLGRLDSLHRSDLILEVAYGQKTCGMHLNGHTPWAHKVVDPEARSYPHVRGAYHGRKPSPTNKVTSSTPLPLVISEVLYFRFSICRFYTIPEIIPFRGSATTWQFCQSQKKTWGNTGTLPFGCILVFGTADDVSRSRAWSASVICSISTTRRVIPRKEMLCLRLVDKLT